MTAAAFGSNDYQFEGFHLSSFDPAVADFIAESLAMIDPWKTLNFSPRALSDYFMQDDGACKRYQILLDSRDGGAQPCGAVGVRSPWLRGPYLEFLGVLPNFHGRGIGAALLKWLDEQAIILGSKNVWVAVSEFNLDARRFYETSGFKLCSRLDGLVMDEKAELLLRKQLS